MSDNHQDDHDEDEELDPEALLTNHKQTGEPLGGHEYRAVVAAGLATADQFDMTGGDLWRYRETFSKAHDDAEGMTAEQFRAWLTEEVNEWCEINSLPPHGEGEDLGDLYREWDEAETFASIGVTLIPAHEDQTLFIVGPNASWLATTGIELGIENETILHNPLSNLRVDVPLSELRSYRDRLRRTADEITSLLEQREDRP